MAFIPSAMRTPVRFAASAAQIGLARWAGAARLLLALPITLYIAILGLLPLATLLLISFWTDSAVGIDHVFTLENYRALVSGDTAGTFQTVLRRTFVLATLVTAVALVLGFATAYYLACVVGPRARTVGFVLLFVPLSTSYLVKVYAWRGLLGERGIINYSFSRVGLIDEPLAFLLFNQFAVALALLSAVLPFMVLPLYAALERVPSNLLEAAADLGADGRFTLLRVIVPLIRRGIVAGCTLVFVLCFGDFIASQLLGGSSGILIGKVIFSSFGLADNAPAGAAMAFVVVLVAAGVLALLSLAARRGGHGGDVALDNQLSR